MNTLKQKRIASGYTLQRLSKVSGISVHTLRQLERGVKKGTPNTWIKLSKALNVPIEELAVNTADS